MFNRKYIRTKILALALVIGYLSGVGPLVEEVARAVALSNALDHIEE